MTDKKTAKKLVTKRETTPPIETEMGPLVFISHDSRDAEFAEAFSNLLKTCCSGMLNSFRSSDNKGTEGIEFGDEWFNQLSAQLKVASDVVCLFTERSLDRPWILYEAGLARGTRQTRVLGIALGIPLGRLNTGPFYHFQNSDDSDDSLTKLVLQLARRVPRLAPDSAVVLAQVKIFKTTITRLLETEGKGVKVEPPPEETLIAKFLEEMKGMVRELPSRVAERMGDRGDPIRRRRLRRFDPSIFEEFTHMGVEPGDPIPILLLASFVREDLPWFYEMALEAYHAMRAGDHAAAERALLRIGRTSDMMAHGPFLEGLGFGDRETHVLLRELPRMIDHFVRRSIKVKKSRRTRPAGPKKPPP